MSPRDLGRLLRISLAPSAAADVAAGVVLGAGGAWPTGPGPWLLICASLGIYTGSMALNDWSDREHDRATRPERPIPSGAVAPGAALAVGLGLVLGGVALALFADASGPRDGRAWGTGPWMLAVASLAVAYDLGVRGPLAGPLLLALCRGGNLGAGLVLARGAWPTLAAADAVFVAPLLYALYVFVASRLGRMEDSEDRLDPGRARRLVFSAALLLVSMPWILWAVLPPTRAGWLPLEAIPATAASWGLFRAARRTDWTLPIVMQTMGLLLRRLLIVSAILALAALRFDGAGLAPLLVAGAILLGYPLAHRLRKRFPPS